MKPFRFRADGLLDLRRTRRNACQADVARAERACRQAVEALEAAVAQAGAASERYVEALRTGGDSLLMMRHQTWIAHLVTEADHRRHHVAQSTRVVAEAVEQLRSAHQAVRVLERLRDRAGRRHELDERRQQNKDIDQIATLRHARWRIEGGQDT